jgi:cell division protein FtsQ
VEQVPVARWGDKGLLNQLGEIFTPDTLSDVDVSSLIQLSAVNPEPREVLTMLTNLLQRINPYGLHVEKIHRQADGSWHVWLVGGEEWLLSAQQSLAAVDQLLLLYGSIPKQEKGNMRIDFRYRDGFAVKWQTKATNPAP